MKKILITPKINPDLDGLACAYAYAMLLNMIKKNKDAEYVCGIYGNFQPEVEFMINYFKIKDFAHNPGDKFDSFIIVDASDIKGMPECIEPNSVVEVIDHRESHKAKELFPNSKIQIELIGAAATLIFERFRENNIEINIISGFLLYGAIHSNSLNLKSGITSKRDVLAASYLKDKFDIRNDFVFNMFKYKTGKIFINLEKNIVNDFKIIESDIGSIGIAQIEGVNVLDLININLLDIKLALKKIKDNNNLDYIFLTSVDIRNNKNFFIVVENETQKMLEIKMNLVFNRGVSVLDKMILRKQIIPLLLK